MVTIVRMRVNTFSRGPQRTVKKNMNIGELQTQLSILLADSKNL
jgi:hypothetical protein